MAGKKSGYEKMMEQARVGLKGKGRRPASSAARSKEAVKMEASKAKSGTTTREDVKMEEEMKVATTSSVGQSVAFLLKKETEFDPRLAAYWKPGEHVPFTFLASAFDSKSNI